MRYNKGKAKRKAEMKVFLAIDIGATSGRHIAGYKEGGEIRLEEVYRFPNGKPIHHHANGSAMGFAED